MKKLSKRIILHFLRFMVFVVIAAALWLFISHEVATKSSSTALKPASDMITTQDLAQGKRLITDVTAHYAVIVPSSWYLEKKGGSGVTVYPDYDAAKQRPPLCKIEISVLENPKRSDVNDWLTDYLHEDPTADVVESSRKPFTISGRPAVTWTGTFNGISSTLAYISREDGLFYEIAPSLINNRGTSGVLAMSSDDRQCFVAFQSLLSSFHILP